MSAKELGFSLKSFFDCHVIINVLLGPALASIVAELQGIDSATQQLKSIGALILKVDFGDNADCTLSFRVYFFCKLQSV